MAYLLHAKSWICGLDHDGLVFGCGLIRRTPIVPALDKVTTQLVAVAYGEKERYRY